MPAPRPTNDTTPPTSARPRALRAIQGDMSSETSTSRRSDAGRVRPDHQAAQVILRMSHSERRYLHQLAQKAGKSTTRYLLDLAAEDAAARSASTGSARSAVMVAKAEEPDPSGPGSHAVAGHAMAVAAS